MVSLTQRFVNPLQYSCLENPMDRAAWQAKVHRMAKCGGDRACTYIRIHARTPSTDSIRPTFTIQLSYSFLKNCPADGVVGSNTRSMLLTSVQVLDFRSRSEVKWSRLVVSDSLWPHRLYPTSLLRPWEFLGKSTGVGCNFLLQRIFLTQGSNPDLLHCRQSLQGSRELVVKSLETWTLVHLSAQLVPLFANRVTTNSLFLFSVPPLPHLSLKYLFICLAAASLSCGTRDFLSCFRWGLLVEAYGI